MRRAAPRSPLALSAHRTLHRLPGGVRLFSAVIAWRAPYFRTIRPRVVHLEPGHAEVTMRNRWAVRNHLGTVHAIACCNLAEIAAALVTEVTIPTDHRWIPVGMQVVYRAKATTDLRAVARIDIADWPTTVPGELVVPVDVVDDARTVVVHADVTMRISPRTRSSGSSGSSGS